VINLMKMNDESEFAQRTKKIFEGKKGRKEI
jgi:hypothetical protein